MESTIGVASLLNKSRIGFNWQVRVKGNVEIEKKEPKYSRNRPKPSLFEMIVKTGNFFYTVLFHEDYVIDVNYFFQSTTIKIPGLPLS